MKTEWVRLLKMLLLMVLPLAGSLGTWVGLIATGMNITPGQYAIIFVFALWTVAGVFVYFVFERKRLNRNTCYR